MNHFQKSWRIFTRSLTLMRRHGKLILFPAISFFAAVVLIALVAGGTFSFMRKIPDGLILEDGTRQGGLQWPMIFAWFLVYFLVMLTGNLCNAAFYREIFHGMNGGTVSILHGFRCAAKRFNALVWWTLFASTIGLVLKLIGGQGGIRSWAMKTLGIVWAVAACFAIPTIVSDPAAVWPMEVLRRSGKTINRTWGEALIGFAGLKLLGYAAFCLWLALSLAFSALAGVWSRLTVPAVTASSALFGIFLLFCYLVGTAEKIYLAALYQYAENGIHAGEYTGEDLTGAFRRED